MIYKNFKDSPWDKERWPTFRPAERWLHCRCCGEFFYDPESMDILQKARNVFQKPFRINSGHRCSDHNKKVGGAKKSAHLGIAFDIDIYGHTKAELLYALQAAGFTTFGFYKDFIHTDKRPGRRWFGEGAERIWRGIV